MDSRFASGWDIMTPLYQIMFTRGIYFGGQFGDSMSINRSNVGVSQHSARMNGKRCQNAISKSGREDYREYVNGVLNDIEAAERVRNMREISRLTRQLTNKSAAISINLSTTRDGSQIVTESQLLKEWEQFLGAKFSRPESDSNRDLKCLVAEDDLLNDTELN